MPSKSFKTPILLGGIFKLNLSEIKFAICCEIKKFILNFNYTKSYKIIHNIYIYLLFIIYTPVYFLLPAACLNVATFFLSQSKPTAFSDIIYISPSFNVISNNFNAENPNRYYSHLAFRSYFRNVPFFVQKFTNPIDSVYIASAIAKIVIQIVFIVVLTLMVIKFLGKFEMLFLTIPILIIPFFQTNGAVETIGIIDPSITYNFFYSLPLLFFLIYLGLFFWVLNNFNNKYKYVVIGLLLILVLIIPFSGPLIAPLMAIFSMIILLLRVLNYEIVKSEILKSYDLKNFIIIFSITSLLISIYSIFLGTYNSIGSFSDVTLSEQYNRLFLGIHHYFIERDELQALILFTLFNSIIIRLFFYEKFGKIIVSIYLLFLFFICIYILLLPFGGYRDYRPFILRYDILMPLTVGLVLFFAFSVVFIIKNSKMYKLKFVFLIIVFYYLIDLHKKDLIDFQSNKCQIEALEELANSNSTKVDLFYECEVLSWGRVNKYEDAYYIGKLLFFWNITKHELTFIHSQKDI
jgi:hypothetical protein